MLTPDTKQQYVHMDFLEELEKDVLNQEEETEIPGEEELEEEEEEEEDEKEAEGDDAGFDPETSGEF